MTIRTMPRPAAVLVASVLATAALLAACGDDDDTATTTTTAPEATTTTTDAGGTTSGPSTTGSSVTTTTTAAPLGDSPPFSDEVASGSGCTPGAGALPDGWWFGMSVAADDGAYTFDLACWYVGAVAEEEAALRGDEVNNDYYIVNDNPALRTVPLAEGATARCVDLDPGPLVEADCPPADIPDPDIPWSVWFRVVGGEVDRLVEQFQP